MKTYTVQPGDTFGEISTKFYGTKDHYKKIMEVNDITDARSLEVGTILEIPDIDDNNQKLEKFTVQDLAAICGSNAKAAKFYDGIKDTFNRYEINTYLRVCHFLAQVLHESGNFRYMEELASGSAYEGRKDLGNTQPGDGKRFKGRGLIQLTGRSNYTAYSKDRGVDFVSNPELIATDPAYCVDVAGWYWNSRKLNKWADLDDMKKITKRINGGYNGLKDRIKKLEICKSVIK